MLHLNFKMSDGAIVATAWFILFLINYVWRRWIGRKIDSPYNYESVGLNIVLGALGPFGTLLAIVFTFVMWKDIFPESKFSIKNKPPNWM